MTDEKKTAAERGIIITPMFRASFPHVFTQGSYDGKSSFSCAMIFDEAAQATAEFKAMKAAASKVAREKWGDNIPGNLRTPFRKGEEKAHLGGYEAGQIFTTARTNTQPEVLDRSRRILTSAKDFYPGCFARAFVHAFAYDNKGKGVSFGLDGIQKLQDGEPLGAGGSVADLYDELPPEEGGAAAPAASAGDPLF